MFSGCDGLKSVNIENGVEIIGMSAFENCIQLTEVIIPDSTKVISHAAFRYCKGLTSVTIGNGIESISNEVFAGCTSLKFNEYKKGDYLGNEDNNYLVLIKVNDTNSPAFVINSSTKIIAAQAFWGYKNLEQITIRENLVAIGGSAFDACNALTSIKIPSNIKSVEAFAFSSCTGLETVIIENGLDIISNSVFCNCPSLTSVTIPNSIRSIERYAFGNCTRLININFQGTKAEWEAIEKEEYWNYNTGHYTVYCTDGNITK